MNPAFDRSAPPRSFASKGSFAGGILCPYNGASVLGNGFVQHQSLKPSVQGTKLLLLVISGSLLYPICFR